MTDTTSEINNHYVEIAESSKVKIPKKKKVFKNNLPDIQEEPLNEEESKAQSQQKGNEAQAEFNINVKQITPSEPNDKPNFSNQQLQKQPSKNNEDQQSPD